MKRWTSEVYAMGLSIWFDGSTAFQEFTIGYLKKCKELHEPSDLKMGIPRCI